MENSKVITIASILATVTGLTISVYILMPQLTVSLIFKGFFGVFISLTTIFLFIFLSNQIHRKKYHKVFLAYSSEQKELAEKLTYFLEKDNFDVKVDFQDINLGDDIYKVLNKEISDSEAIIFLVSNEFSKSKFLQKEVEIASKNNKRLIPVITDENAKIPSRLKSLSYFTLLNPTEKNFNQFKYELNGVLA